MVVLAGLSQEIGQIVILFLNRIKPGRFVFSLLINALLFCPLAFWPWWAAPGSLPWPRGLRGSRLKDLVIVLGLAYAPLLFAFLGALPYLGVPILSLLSIWHLLAMVVGFGAIANLSISQIIRLRGLWVVCITGSTRYPGSSSGQTGSAYCEHGRRGRPGHRPARSHRHHAG